MSRTIGRRVRGFTLIEVLVTVLVLLIGLLGMFGMQSRATTVEMESYQRAQALALLKDMESRLRSNRAQFDAAFRQAYASEQEPAIFGTGSTVRCTDATGALREVCQWGDALRGAAEAVDGAQVGAMIGARGCRIASSAPTADAVAEFFLVVLWQGLTPTEDPPEGTPASVCAPEVDYGGGRRRALTNRVLIPKLED